MKEVRRHLEAISRTLAIAPVAGTGLIAVLLSGKKDDHGDGTDARRHAEAVNKQIDTVTGTN